MRLTFFKTKKYILQRLKGCVMAFSYHQLHPKALLCINVRSGGGGSQDFGFKNGFVDIDGIIKFLNGNTGYVTKWYNQAQGMSTTPDLVQTDNSKQPQVALPAVMGNNYMYFDGSASYLWVETPNTETNILTQPIGIYTKTARRSGFSGSRYVFTRNTSGTTDRSYGQYNNPSAYFIFAGNSRGNVDNINNYAGRLQPEVGGSGYTVFSESDLGTSKTDTGALTVSTPGNNIYVGQRGGGTGSNIWYGTIGTILLFNTLQSENMYELIRKEGI